MKALQGGLAAPVQEAPEGRAFRQDRAMAIAAALEQNLRQRGVVAVVGASLRQAVVLCRAVAEPMAAAVVEGREMAVMSERKRVGTALL